MKKTPTLKTGAEAERFVDTADLSNMIFRLAGFEKELALARPSVTHAFCRKITSQIP